MPDLPSVEEAREFLEVINRGREAAGLEPLKYLEFDEARPGLGNSCLSATNLFLHVEDYGNMSGGPVGTTYVVTSDEVAQAIGATDRYGEFEIPEFEIPEAILKVTDPFDNEAKGLRERLVEAGVVAP